MSAIGSSFIDIGYMETLARGDSPVHRLDPRAKLLTTLAFIVSVVSFDKYALPELMPFFVFPVALIARAGLPAGYLFRKVMLVLPFAAVVAMFNPLLDRQVVMQIGPLGVTAGWVSFFSITARFFLTVSAALVLVATTGFNAVCLALSRLGLPRPFVVQLLFLYRYMFVLMEEAERLMIARSLRAFTSRPMGMKTFASLAGHLLLRTLDRAQRIYLAMFCRGFDGRIRLAAKPKAGAAEAVFVLSWSLLFIALRWVNVPLLLGGLVTGRHP